MIVSYSEQDNIDTTLLVQQFNIDERKRKELALEKDVITDPLTGLLNRRGLNNAVGQKDSFVIFYLDLDGFKLINDSLGHAVGDQVLQHLAAKLTGSELKHGLACRFGGDEFIWLVDEDKLTTSIEATANLLFQVMNEPFLDNEGRPIKISASVGIANYPADGNDFNELILKADAAMYLAKKQGKHRWVNYISGMENTLQRHSMLAQYLYKALDNNEFSLHYQPIINTKTNTVDSLEALLRWHNSEIGPVPADECIKVAEEIGVIVALEQWVIATAIADIKDFQKVFGNQIKVAINVSSHFLANSASIDFIVQQLAVNQQNISSINIELTESALLANLSHENNMAQQFNQQGIALSIDDFGTGFSSLAYLDQIPAKYIKIDRSFTNKIECDSTMLIGIQHLIQSLGFNTIVEGVETLQQAKILQEIGIELMQGYGLARPQPLSYYQQTCNLANLVLKI
ncbi:EAL domain-containing protein [Endozoicomonas sp. G2_1]|uniref:putative bifunctional diguanylate cyclase/phosphodiesterase n=1 Tax=Endozoicomonas sp. G2_1 TaxID=2821091 RepID=UPI001ADA2C6D|nr:EAL domain-containing protein [Endozoicomonas sp. G2_1]MBO9489551.1 EAL domain-containing protein [Endozoicomonas sp. G2_1]